MQNHEARRLNTQRVQVYDWLRLLATILVVVGHSDYLQHHTIYGGISFPIPENANSIYFAYLYDAHVTLVEWIYSFHMPLFFMLSGAVLALRPITGMGGILKSKTKRLLLPYLLCGCLFMIPIKRIVNFYDDSSVLLAVGGFLSGRESGHLWFLLTLFWIILAFVALLKILSKLNIKSEYALLFICGIGQFMAPYITSDFLCLQKALSYILYFAIGYVFEHERRKAAPWTIKKTLLIFFALIAVELFNVRYSIRDSFCAILTRSLIIYTLAHLLDRTCKNIPQKNWWKLITRNLFYVYLFHDPLEYVVLKTFFSANLLTNPLGEAAYVFCRTVVVFAVSLLLGEGINALKNLTKSKNAGIKSK